MGALADQIRQEAESKAKIIEAQEDLAQKVLVKFVHQKVQKYYYVNYLGNQLFDIKCLGCDKRILRPYIGKDKFNVDNWQKSEHYKCPVDELECSVDELESLYNKM